MEGAQNLPLGAAMDQVVLDELPPETGGMIGVCATGAVHAVYNTHGMFTGLPRFLCRWRCVFVSVCVCEREYV